MLSILNKYQLFISLLKVKNLTTAKLNSVAKMAGYTIDDSLLEIILELIQGQAEVLQTDSLFDVLKDKETQAAILALTESKALAKLETTVEKQSVKGEEDKAIDWNLYVHKDNLITCPHCSNLVHIRSAISSKVSK